MKIWFRIGAEQGGEQSRRQNCSVNLAPRPPLSSRTLQAGKRTSRPLRRGAARCARFSAADQRYPLADTRSIPAVGPRRSFRVQPTGPETAPAAKKLLKTERFFRSGHTTSNRCWCENRSYRKQTSKPHLTGARTPIRDLRFLTLFIDSFAMSNHRRWLKTRRFFQPGRTTSTRFWSKSRSYRKQTVKPLLPGATTTCRDLALRRVLLLPGEIATNELY
jgi:hypothetical protein